MRGKLWAGIIAAVVVPTGCATEPLAVSALHSPLARSSPQRKGVIFVRQLEDARLQQLRRFVGSTGSERAGAPPIWSTALILDRGEKLGPLLTGYVANALRHAGYETVIESLTPTSPSADRPVDGIVEGESTFLFLRGAVGATGLRGPTAR